MKIGAYMKWWKESIGVLVVILGTVSAILGIIYVSFQIMNTFPLVLKSTFEKEVEDLQNQINRLTIEMRR